MSECGDMSIDGVGLLFQWASTIKNTPKPACGLCTSHWKWTCSCHDIAEKLL